MRHYSNTDQRGSINMNGNTVSALVLDDDTDALLHGKPGRMARVLGRLLFCVGYEEPGNPNSSLLWIQCLQEKTAHVHIQSEAASQWNIVHNMNTTRVIVQVYDMDGSVISVDSIDAATADSAVIKMTEAIVGYAVVLSGTASGMPVAAVRYEQEFTTATTVTVTHNLGYEPVIRVLSIEGLEILPDSIQHNTVNTATVTLKSSTSGKIICT